MLEQITAVIDRGCQRALVELNRDRWSTLRGCFDRRHWGWKLVDYAEATYQRLVLPLIWFAERADADQRAALRESIAWALEYAAHVQHADGSFDQAFPHEHSWGATAFLLQPLAMAIRAVESELAPDERKRAIDMCHRAATFVARRHEAHGRITNHLAGGAYGLFAAADLCGDSTIRDSATSLLDDILRTQSAEGWFPEYDGADPGYHSLCVYYLASIATVVRDTRLDDALRRATEFASWFVHPDGTYGGEYGSRRTAICYAGGFARLARGNPLAARITWATTRAALGGHVPTPDTIDVGNLAPVLSNWCDVADAWGDVIQTYGRAELPHERSGASADFPKAGLFARGTTRRYAVVGAATGGVLVVHDKATARPIAEDAGYLAESASGERLTSQSNGVAATVAVAPSEIRVRAPFVPISEPVPTPERFLILRILNLTAGRSIVVGNLMKNVLVRLLVQGSRSEQGTLERRITFREGAVQVEDTIAGLPPGTWILRNGARFSSVHMASARYYPRRIGQVRDAGVVDDRRPRLSHSWTA